MRKLTEEFVRREAAKLRDCAQLIEEKPNNQFILIAACGEASKLLRRMTDAALFDEVPGDYLRNTPERRGTNE